MTEYDNSGTISKNERKDKASQPDIRGKCTVDGVEYWISGWQKRGRDGSTFYSLSFQKKDANVGSGGSPGSRIEDSDDIPF